MLTTYAIVAAVAYLLGSIPFGYILVRVFRGEDVRATGSGNIGATNVARKAPGLGVATLILDASKGFIAVVVTKILTENPACLDFLHARPDASYFAMPIAALAAVVGHMYPVWLKFRGGKGVATSVGAFLALAPKAVLVVVLLFAAVVAAFRYVSLGSILAAAAFPVMVYVLYRGSPLQLLIVCVTAALIILKHHANIRRLLAGTEHRFEFKRTQA